MNHFAITGHVEMDLPLTWAEIRPHLTDASSSDHPDPLSYRHNVLARTIRIGGLMLRLEPHDARLQAAAVTGDPDATDGTHINDALAQIIADFATTPDGTARTFTGHLECHEPPGHPWYVYALNGEAITLRTWSDSFNDAAETTQPQREPDVLYIEVVEHTRYWLPVTPDDTSDWDSVTAAAGADDIETALSEQADDDLHALAADHAADAEIFVGTEREFGAITTTRP